MGAGDSDPFCEGHQAYDTQEDTSECLADGEGKSAVFDRAGEGESSD